ncbi:type II CAAX endopeptidase family protein [Ekhidna sp.]|uniref:CPBP family intramembrane glutamic endopeptidase n=1 Tax=Ekhidna sp. TaxID=2608089 RepID=UPI0032ED2EE8
MIGILIILVASWLLLYLIERKHLNVLGIVPTGIRIQEFGLGVLITGLLCVAAQMMEVWLKSAHLEVSENSSLSNLLEGMWWDFKSVLTEELIYRGALLFLLIQRLGSKAGIAISATAFGIYHWFSFGVFGNSIPMILIFIGTGLMGYAWALSFHKTKSIMLGFGLHLGWNFVYNTIFSKGPLGEMILVMEGGATLGDVGSLINFLVPMIVIPGLILLFIVKGVKG